MTMKTGKTYHAVLATLAISFGFACKGNDRGSGSASAMLEAACTAVEACEGDEGRMECEATFTVAVPPPGCLQAVETASCEDHAADDPPYTDTCFPPCNAPEQHCEGGTVAGCSEFEDGLRELQLDCAEICAQQGFRFSGTCGEAFGEQQLRHEVCWCEGNNGPVGVSG